MSDLTQPYLFSIPAGVIDLLLGQQPHASGLGLDTVFLIVDVLIFVLSALALWSAIRLIRRWRQPLKRTPVSLLWGLVLPLLWEVALPIGLFIEIPKLAGASWTVAMLYWLDVGFWMLGMFVLLLITGMTRIVRVVRSYMRSSGNRRTFPIPA